jgi:3',5'-cyclic-AMP phosphodiesterase
MMLAHLSDTHLDGSERSVERTTRVMRYLNDLPHPPDAVLVTGDLANNGLAQEYRDARKLFSSPSPVLTCPGNHDVRRAYREALLGLPGEDTPVNQLHQVGAARFAMCDSTVPGRNEGVLAEETLAWLDAQLAAAPDAPTFVCMHHPPVDLHHPMVDTIRLHGEDRLAAVIDRHSQVVAVLCGHAHTAAASSFAGRPMLVAPGVDSTMRLPWEDGEDPDMHAPPGVAFHVLVGHRLTTHYRVVDG